MKKSILILVCILGFINCKAQWEDMGMHFGSLNLICAKGDTIIGSGTGSYLYKSVDGGYKWKKISSIGGINKLVLINNSVFCLSLGGLYRSTDWGDNFILLNNLAPVTNCKSLYIYQNVLYAGYTNGFVYRSINNGDSWNKLGDNPGSNINDIVVHNSKLITANSVGKTYTYDSTSNIWTASSTALSIGNFVSCPSYLLGTAASTGMNKSTDGGVTWSTFNGNLAVDNRYFESIQMHNNIIYAALPKGLYTSSDYGVTWVKSNLNINVGELHDVSYLYHNSNALYLSYLADYGEGHGVRKWTNNYTQVERIGLNTSYITSTMVFGDELYVGTKFIMTPGTSFIYSRGSVFKFNFSNSIWSNVSDSMPRTPATASIWSLLKDSSNNLFAGSTNGEYVWKTSNNGQNWSNVHSVSSGGGRALCYFNGNIYTGENKIYRSSDNGNSWVIKNTGMPTSFSLTSFFRNGNTLFACAGAGSNSSTLNKTINNGDSWTSVTLPTGITETYSGLTYNSKIYIATNKGVYISSDGGSTWAASNNGLPTNATVISIVNSGSNFAISTEGQGIYTRNNDANNWINVDDNLNDLDSWYTDSVSLTVYNGKLIAGTRHGIYSRDFSNMYCSVTQPTITASNNFICAGSTVTLSSTTANTSSYSWSNGMVGQNISVSIPGTYSVTIDSAGCTATSNSITITSGAAPTKPTIAVGGPTSFCQGGSVMLVASTSTNILWSNNSTSQFNTVTATGDYYVTVTGGNGCTSNSDTVVVTVDDFPAAPTITANGPTTFCSGSSVTLTSSAAASYSWLPGNQSTQSIVISSAGSFYVYAISSNGCKSQNASTVVNTSISNSLGDISITVNPNTPALGSNAIVSSVNNGNATYQWQSDLGLGYIDLPNLNQYSGVTTNALLVSNLKYRNHEQPFRLIAESGTCKDTSNIAYIMLGDTCFITVTDTLLINTVLTNVAPNYVNTIKIYPNPAKDHIIINYGNYAALNGYTLKITNVLGQEMYNALINQASTSVDLNGLSGYGVYFVHLINDSNVTIDVRKLVIE